MRKAGRSALVHVPWSLCWMLAASVAAGCGSSDSPGDDGSAASPDSGMLFPDAARLPDLVRVDLGPCGGPCTGDTPYCDARAGRCVGCRDDRDCGPGTLCRMGSCAMGCSVQHGCGDAGVCQLDGGVCIECLDDGDCARLGDPQRSLCDRGAGRCIACRAVPDSCPAQQYCRVEMGRAQCVPGCKTVFDCPAPDGGGALSCCDHACVDTTGNKSHCGQCGLDCGPDPDAACCASACVHTASDVKACGACGKACSFANAAATCSAGTCKLGACTPGFDNCNANPPTAARWAPAATCSTAACAASPARCPTACRVAWPAAACWPRATSASKTATACWPMDARSTPPSTTTTAACAAPSAGRCRTPARVA